MISRIAPTPNGELHWGNFMNFAMTWAIVRKVGGTLWLRFDDIDQDRCEERYEKSIRNFLHYVGIDWDHEYSKQYQHLAQYWNFLQEIPHYVCACSRSEIQARTGDFHYDGFCRDKKLSYQAGANAIRFRHPSEISFDFILWRREHLPAYHLTSVYDDYKMGVDFVVRGSDLLESTQMQCELSKSLSYDPLGKVTFVHHPLLTHANGDKLAKSRADGELFHLMDSKVSPSELWQGLTSRMNLPEKVKNAQDFMHLVHDPKTNSWLK